MARTLLDGLQGDNNMVDMIFAAMLGAQAALDKALDGEDLSHIEEAVEHYRQTMATAPMARVWQSRTDLSHPTFKLLARAQAAQRRVNDLTLARRRREVPAWIGGRSAPA